ncbi:MAG: PEP-CTERM sorting domain-containing protein [Planctomycetota bacterium]|jgi:hypothetical protein
MQISKVRIAVVLAAVAGASTPALADFVVTQSSDPAPTYAGHSVTFDEDDVPIGVNMDPFDFYAASDGISFTSGSGFLVAENWDALEGIAGGTGDGNSLNGGFSVRMLFDTPVNEISWQGWANGSPSPPLGGINVVLFSEGVQVGAYSGVAPFAGPDNSWFNVVATGGDSFDEIRFFNGAFNSFNSYVDNISYNNVPAPGALALLGAAAFMGGRRRRNG